MKLPPSERIFTFCTIPDHPIGGNSYVPTLGHGETITIEQFQRARESVAESVAEIPMVFTAAQPADLKDFDFKFPKLQKNANNLLR